MTREDKIWHLLEAHKPRQRNYGGIYGVALRALAGTKPNKERTEGDRELEAYRKWRDNMYFLAGMMLVMPQGGVLAHQAEELLLKGWDVGREAKFGSGAIRRIGKHGEDIVKLLKHVRMATKKLDENIAATMK